MKPTRLILTVLVPLCFLAAASSHQALSPIHFGMSEKGAQAAQSMLYHELQSRGGPQARLGIQITGETLISRFITSGTRAPGKLAAKDGMLKLGVAFVCNPKLSQITVSDSRSWTAEDYPQSKETWEILQDICDRKFQRAEGSKAGGFPAIETLPPDTQFTVTDTWKEDGIRIDLGIWSKKLPAVPTARILYWPQLVATDEGAGK